MSDSNRRYCVVKGIAGVGNRLFTVARAVQYAEAAHRTLYVDWRDGMNGSNGDDVFYEYFDLHGIDHISSPDPVLSELKIGRSIYPRFFGLPNFDRPLSSVCMSVRPRLIKKNKAKVLLSSLFRHKAGNLIGLDSWQVKSGPVSLRYRDSLRGCFSSNNFPLGARMSTRLKEDIVIFADYQPVVHPRWFRDHISLKEKYLEQFREFAIAGNLSEAIGIHIRYTDKKPTAALSRAVSALRALLRKEPHLKVFLATDNRDVLQDFQEAFKEKLIVYPKSLPPVSAKGLHYWAKSTKDTLLKKQVFEAGLADMWLLSMTKYLFRQGNSSFSHISKLLRDNPFRTYDWLKL